MLDFRLETFLALSRIGNYTKTAQALHITQPAVSQHIKYLEEYYGGKLFCYRGKTLTLTQRGETLLRHLIAMRADSLRLRETLQSGQGAGRRLNFGATLSIGEFICPHILGALLEEAPDLRVHMPVENTERLLEKLENGEIDFALIEGFFDKAQYDYTLFSNEPFIAVCSGEHPLGGRRASMEQLMKERIIIREKGSGTRNVFEQLLREHNFSIGSFSMVSEIGNMNAIKRLVERNLGVTFLYRAAAKEELATGKLREIDVENISVEREFNFVALKDSRFLDENRRWYQVFQEKRP